MEKPEIQHLESASSTNSRERQGSVVDPDTGEKLVVVGKTDYSGAVAKTDPAEIALVRKLDIWIMPILWIMYPLASSTILIVTRYQAVARLNNLEDELGLSVNEYLTCVSILFVGYIAGQIPANMLITKFRPSWFMATFMSLWAIVSALTALSQGYIGLLLTRFFLGILEAPFYPGAIWLLGSFYTRKEVATRISVLYSANMIALSTAGLIAIGIFRMDGLSGISGWRWLFIIQGALTLVIALSSFVILPNEPLKTWWLTDDEKQLAHDRIARDTVQSSARSNSSWKGLFEAAKDPRVWLFVFIQHQHLASNGFKNVLPTVVETLRFNETITLVLTCPPYLLAGLASILYAMSSGKFNERTWHISAAKFLAIIGFVLCQATLNVGARYFGMVLFCLGTYAANSIIYGWVTATCGQTPEKKASSTAIVSALSNIAFVWTPYLWPDSDAPLYRPALLASAAFSLTCAMGAWAMKFWLKRLNKQIAMSGDESILRYAY